jgi:hypothetical protein
MIEEIWEELDLHYEILQDRKQGKNKSNSNKNNSTEDTALNAQWKV